MSSLELGLSHLATIALVFFLTACILKGFTLARVLLLVFPFAACIFLDFSDPARGIPRSEIDHNELREVLLWADLYLAVILGWIVAFPVPLAVIPPERAAVYKRLEWALAVVFAASLVLSTFRIGAPMRFLTPFEAQPIVARSIQSLVLAVYFFLLVKLALRSEFSLSGARQD